jgi:hypothetical protein
MQDTIVAQRLKRTPSIIAKLKRFPTIPLAEMQDIGGLRAVVANVESVRQLQEEYKKATFGHNLKRERDYIAQPKPDGYRSVHLVFRYKNNRVPAYDGLWIELQIRTSLQHAWATAVETMETFLGQPLKAGRGPVEWLRFFAITGSACAYLENSPLVPGYQHLFRRDTLEGVRDAEQALGALATLKAYSSAVHSITQMGHGSYHLITLNSREKTVTIHSYPQAELADATEEYARNEARATGGEPIETVLVSAGRIAELRRAYPNYFLDTKEFVDRVESMIHGAQSTGEATS